MKRLLNITTSIDQPGLLESMIERLASRRNEIGYSNEPMPGGWEAIETASTEMYVSGTVEFMFNEQESIRMPFTTCFFYTCFYGKNDNYRLIWNISLS